MKKTKIQTLDFLKTTKEALKQNRYRKEFDSLCEEIKINLVDTDSVKERIDQSESKTHVIYTTRPDGSRDWVTLPGVKGNSSSGRVPRAAEPISFSKILIAASAISSRPPDGTTYSTNKIKARAYYEMLKRSWVVPEMNGYNTLNYTTQNVLTYGWAAWRQSPKRTIVDKTVDGIKSKKIIFDDIFREPLDVSRTWLGLSYKPYINDNRPEVLWETDITKDSYTELKKRFSKKSKLEAGVSDEAQREDSEKITTHTTITFYEDPINNRYIIASDNVVFYDGEIPNDDCYGTIVVAQCFSKDMNNPYGVGLFELMRGNSNTYNYINSLNAEQVEAEIFPLLFGIGLAGQGDLTFSRTSNKLNSLPQGASIEKVSTSGNATLGMNYANAQKRNIEENTGVNNIVAGSSSEGTLGATVILKEAALNRLIKPRNSLAQAIENDACMFFSNIEQQQMTPREFVFADRDEVEMFMQLNPEFEHNLSDDVEFDELGIPKKMTVKSSQYVSMGADYSKELLTESDYENQNINEMGDNKYNISKSSLLSNVKKLDQASELGYGSVLFKVDSNSMLIPSFEIQKQASAAIFPLVQNSIQIIYGLAKADPMQAVAQLKTLSTFMEVQKENIFDYIPKDQYDMIMAQTMGQPMMPGMDPSAMGPGAPSAMTKDGMPLQSDNTPVTTPQSPQEVATQQSQMGSALDASVGKL